MARLIFIFGACRSGKSSYAVNRFKNMPSVAYIATSLLLDDEMQLRVKRHKQERPDGWTTIESPLSLSKTIQQIEPDIKYIILDCLTMYLANNFGQGEALEQLDEQERFEEWLRDDMRQLISGVKSLPAEEVIIIGNEVGAGIVPVSRTTRFFRDMCGLMNRIVAVEADEVIKMEAGLINRLK